MLQVAAMSERKLTEAMTVPETEERLKKVLELHFKDSKGKPFRLGISSWRKVAELETKEERLLSVQPANDLLVHLSFRCFPTYRPVIAAYLKVLSDLVDQNTEGIEDLLVKLTTFRVAETARHTKLVDLLDWYHLSSVKEESGEFDEYLKMKENLRSRKETHHDPLNRYLDRVQKIFDEQKDGE